MTRYHRRRLLLAGLILAGVAVYFLAGGGAPLPSEGDGGVPPATSATAVVRAVELIAPGTVIEDGTAPQGWSHLVLKSKPVLAKEDVGKIPSWIVPLATFLFTANTADVRAEEGERGEGRSCYLNRIGVGVGAAVGGKDVILSPETQAELGAGLGVLGRQVLAEVYQRQKEVRLVAATRTMGVIDTPAFLRLNGGHRKAVIRYAFLVGPRTGRLDSLAWRIDLDDGGGYAGMGGPVEWLPPALRVRPTLHVDLNEFNALWVASEKAFAAERIPQGKDLEPPEDLRELLGRPGFRPEEVGRLEERLRGLTAGREPPHGG